MTDKEPQAPRMAITPDADDIANYKSNRKNRINDRIGDVPVVKGGGGGGGNGFILFLLLLIVAGAAGGGYFLYEELEATRAQLQVDQARIERMERQLMITDESVSETTDSVQKQLAFLDSEVRKLWDNVWRRSREQFAEHDKRLEALEKSGKASEGQITAARQQLTTLGNQVQTATTRAEEARRELVALKASVEAGGGMNEEIAKLEKRIKANEEWVQSINAFRRQVNRDIDSLRESVAGQ